MPTIMPRGAVTLVAIIVLALTAGGCGRSSPSSETSSRDTRATILPGSRSGTSPTDGSGAGATQARDHGPNALTDSSWTLTSYGTPTGTQPASVTSPATITFRSNGTISGTGGCNHLSANYQVPAPAQISFSMGAMTQMACADPDVNLQEQAVITALAMVQSYALTEDTLTLSGQGSVLLSFEAAPNSLAGTAWMATGVNNGHQGVESAAGTERLTLRFGDGTIVGFDGCNDLTGSYTTDPRSDAIALTVEAAAANSCTPDVTELAGQYRAALRASTTYQRNPSMLTLRDAGGATQVNLIPAR